MARKGIVINMCGKKEWYIADGFMSNTQNGKFVSHEAVCVLNVTDEKAEIGLTIFFEDREPLTGFCDVCEGKRTKHIRLDKIKNDKGEGIPTEVPYAVAVESTVPVIVQHSRMDVSQPEMTLMTTIAY